MELKFKGTLEELIEKLKLIDGIWDLTVPNRKVLGTKDGAIINWYPSTGTLQLQGKEDSVEQLKEWLIELLNIPKDTHSVNKSESGITVGLIESLINISRVLKGRLAIIEDESIVEALNNLQNDEDVMFVFSKAKTLI